MKKLLGIIVISLMLMLTACQSSHYTFENPIYPDDIKFNETEVDSDISLDGVLDEAFYDDLEGLMFSSNQN